jgi:hypothetical protein
MRNILIAIVLVGLLSGCVRSKMEPSYPESKGAVADDTAYATVSPAPAPPVSAEMSISNSPIIRPAPKRVSGNSHIGRVSSGSNHHNGNLIMSHAYTVVDSEDELKALFDTLTYVIIPYDLSGQELGQNSQKYKRYKRVLELIQEHQKVDNNISKESFAQKGKNKFVILSKEKGEKKVTIESYSYKLANTVLDFFRAKYAEGVFNSEGPFLITTTQNILYDNRNEYAFLYLNLSTFNDSAIEQVLESYKSRLVSDTLDEVGLLEKLHYSLLSFATNFNADMHIIQSAVAGEL